MVLVYERYIYYYIVTPKEIVNATIVTNQFGMLLLLLQETTN